MSNKEKLTPEQQAERTEGLYKNLESQAYKIFKHDRSGSIDTRKPYFAAEKRFCRFLAENYSLQNLKNVEPRHFYAFAEDMKAKGLSTSYIYATLSAIRYYNDKLGGRYEMPKDNKELHLEKRHPGALNRAWMDSEIEKACRVAYEMKGGGDHLDIIAAFRLGQRFGLRVNESVQVKVGDLEYALRTRQFHVPRGKCGQRRDIPVTIKEQITLLEKLLAYAKKKGKESGDYLLAITMITASLKRRSVSSAGSAITSISFRILTELPKSNPARSPEQPNVSDSIRFGIPTRKSR